MTGIELKVLRRMGNNSISISKIEEMCDAMTRRQLARGYTDEVTFKSPKQWAETVVNNLEREGLVYRAGNDIRRL